MNREINLVLRFVTIFVKESDIMIIFCSEKKEKW